MRTATFTDAQGDEITYDVYLAAEPRGVVQIAHGVGEHALRYRVLAEALTEQGFHVYADDHRGHGRTGLRQHGGDATRLGRLGTGGQHAARDAVHQLSQIVRAEHPDLPLVLLGHSWGSFLAQMNVNRHAGTYDALVLSGSAYRMPGSMNAGDLNKPWRGEDANGVEWLSRDPQVQQEFLEDPLTTDTSLQKLFGPLNALRLFGRPARDVERDLPTYLMVGEEDTVGGPASVRRLADAYRERSGFTDVETVVYPGARHEIFNETNADEVRADLFAWLDRRFPRP